MAQRRSRGCPRGRRARRPQRRSWALDLREVNPATSPRHDTPRHDTVHTSNGRLNWHIYIWDISVHGTLFSHVMTCARSRQVGLLSKSARNAMEQDVTHCQRGAGPAADRPLRAGRGPAWD